MAPNGISVLGELHSSKTMQWNRYGQRHEMKPASIFTTLSDDDFAELISATAFRRAGRCEVVFDERQVLSHLYILQSGSLKLVRPFG